MRDAPSDEQLAAQAAGGDRAAFDVLVRRHKEPLYRFVRRYIGRADDAYDILQDSFISAWTRLHRYDCSRPFAPWLRVIALNKCRDFARRETVRRTLLRLVTVEPQRSSLDEIEASKAEIHASARLSRLDRAIANLPAFYKEPLLLTMAEGLSQDEAAKMLNTTRKAIEMRLRRARRRLAAEIGEKEEG